MTNMRIITTMRKMLKINLDNRMHDEEPGISLPRHFLHQNIKRMVVPHIGNHVFFLIRQNHLPSLTVLVENVPCLRPVVVPEKDA